MTDPDETGHAPWCRCSNVGAIKRWLAYTPEEGRYPVGVTVKIATYGGVGSGSGEPDRHYDQVVREVAYRFALAGVQPDRLRVVAEAWQSTGDPLRRHPVTGKLNSTEGPLVHPKGPKNAQEAVMGKLNIDSATLFRQIDECARKMAVILGERCEGRPRRLAKLFSVLEVEEADPVRWKRYPAPVEKALVRCEELERDAYRGGPFDPSVTGDFPPAPRGSG